MELGNSNSFEASFLHHLPDVVATGHTVVQGKGQCAVKNGRQSKEPSLNHSWFKFDPLKAQTGGLQPVRDQYVIKENV